MTWMQTFSGRQLDLVDPQPDMIDLVDITSGLANECRYAGQCRFFYSVAQHSVLASQIVPAEHAFEALLHDATEAYLKDIPRPVKLLLPDYRALEHKLEAVIRARFGLPIRKSQAVADADMILLATERRDLMSKCSAEWTSIQGVTPLDTRIRAVHARHAKSLFMERTLEILQRGQA